MHALEAKEIVTKFNTALNSNDIAAAIAALRSVKPHHFHTFRDLHLLPVIYVEYMQNAPATRKHLVELERLVKCVAEKFPFSYTVLYAEFIYCSQITFDNICAYSILRTIERAYEKEIDISFCNYACALCIALKRFEEAQSWLVKGRSLIRPENITLTIAAFNTLEANILQRNGKHLEAIQVIQSIEGYASFESCCYTLAQSYFILHEHALAENYIVKAIELQPDAQNYIQYAQILFSTQRYDDCLIAARRAQIQIEDEWGARNCFSEFEEHLHVESFKMLIKAALKTGKIDEARVYLESAKKVVVHQEHWQDIEDLWPETNSIFSQCLQKWIDQHAKTYPRISNKALFFIARADAITECLANLELWYDAICRDRGLAFEIILRDIVCNGENAMDLNSMIGYVNSKPGDLLYGSKMLHVLRNIRNRNSHDHVATAEDIHRSRQILFEEVLERL